MSPITQRHLWGLKGVQSLREKTYSLDAIGSQFRSVSLPLGQPQRLSGSPHEASAAHPWETQAYPDAGSQFLLPKRALFTGAQGAEQPGHGSASGREKRVCGRCGKVFKRNQETARHVREAHESPRQCPLCPFQWKRPCKIQKHLISAHGKELTPVVEAIRVLRGQDVVGFVETFEFLRNFELPETTASSPPPFLNSGGPLVPVTPKVRVNFHSHT
ncbi:hypothetical protein EDB92DRAFT_1816048 [Lactarius akahatsu]|uniref:C2H2-type domain-containing protein n=1 Tax=Lactarius akahatsu TaxID=416441 RepID=A0AAD4LHU3_9AGAM|nr:hypothetical protein EDB92DRAFT_1816048 [Lactarius akahatsu]